MGCAKVKKNSVFDKKAVVSLKNFLFVYLVVSMFVLAFLTPVVLGGPHSTRITVTFTPTSGDISLNVSVGHASFGNTPVGTTNKSQTEAGGTSAYLIYNNGSGAAKVYVFQNYSTDAARPAKWFAYDTTSGLGAKPGNFSLVIENSSSTYKFVRNTNSSSCIWISSLGSNTSNAFGVKLSLAGNQWSQQLAAQRTRINFTGVVA